MLHTFIPMTPFQIGEIVTSDILVYSSLNDFLMKKLYANENTFDLAFRELDLKMQLNYNKTNDTLFKIDSPYVGQPVAALYEDNKWYRAEIIKINKDNKSVDVLFVDYGNIGNIQLNNLRHLAAQFFKYEIQIFRCKLHGVDALQNNKLIRATNFFYDTTEDLCKMNKKTIKLVIKNITGTERSSSIYKLLCSLIYSVEINYPLEDSIINENFDLIKLLNPGIRVQTEKHLFLIRHGNYNVNGIHDEKTLTKQGIEQANLTGKYLRDLANVFSYAELITSPIIRAKQTTEQIMKYFPQLVVKMDNSLSEVAPLLVNDENKQINHVYNKYLQHGPIKCNNHTTILVCHANLIRALICKVQNKSAKFWCQYGLHHCSISHMVITPYDEIKCSYDIVDFLPDELKTII